MRMYPHQVSGDTVQVYVPETYEDCREFLSWVKYNEWQPIAVDTETTGLDIYSPGYRLRTVQFGDQEVAFVLHWEKGGYFKEAALQALHGISWFTIHNAPFDWLVLDRHADIPMETIWNRTIDTKILAHLVDPRQRHEGGTGTSLEDLIRQHLNAYVADEVKASMKNMAKETGTTLAKVWAEVDIDNPTYNKYAGMDSITTARIYPILKNELSRLGVDNGLVQYEHELAYICSYMQRTGMVLDHEYVSNLDDSFIRESLEYTQVASDLGVGNVNATAQVAEALSGMGEQLTETTETGKVKVDKSVLLQLADLDQNWERLNLREPNPLANAVLHSKRAGKWRSAYVKTFQEVVDADGRIHPMINALQARTGRMSITRPALQTLPSSDYMVRRAFLADPGEVMVSTDFKAVEMRVLAALADVKKMKEAICGGEDLHDYTAGLVFGPDFTKAHRKLAKGIGFGKVYGGGATTIQRQTGAPLAEVKAALVQYDRVYPEIKRISKIWQHQAKENGYVFVSATGRRLPLDRDRMYSVVNYACQSFARDCLGQSLVTARAAGLLPHLRLPIHDEILASAPKAEAEEIAREIQKCMTFDVFGVPIESDPEIGGRSWGSLYGADV